MEDVEDINDDVTVFGQKYGEYISVDLPNASKLMTSLDDAQKFVKDCVDDAEEFDSVQVSTNRLKEVNDILDAIEEAGGSPITFDSNCKLNYIKCSVAQSDWLGLYLQLH